MGIQIYRDTPSFVSCALLKHNPNAAREQADNPHRTRLVGACGGVGKAMHDLVDLFNADDMQDVGRLDDLEQLLRLA